MDKKLLKIYHDGNHFVAHEVKKADKTSGHKHKEKTDLDSLFDMTYFLGVQKDIKGKSQMVDFICKEFYESYCLERSEEMVTYVENNVSRKLHNLHKRKDRFRRKANLNKWNYFVTFTYDNKKHTANSFKRKLRKCLANLHTRRGWKYMGVFELSPENKRVHFHGLLYIPDGEMVGEIIDKKDWSICDHKMQTSKVNTFFLDHFGRNDMQKIEANPMTINYILKYVEKSGEKIVYSRGIATEITKLINNEDIATEFEDFIVKMVLFDNVIDDKDIYSPSLVLFKDKPKVYRQCKLV